MKVLDKILDIPMVIPLGEYLAGAYRTEEDGQRTDHLLLYLSLERRPCNLRINSACFTGDILGDRRCDCSWQLGYSLSYITEQRQGLLIYHMHHEGRGRGLVQKLRDYHARTGPRADRQVSPLHVAAEQDMRRYESSALILRDLGIGNVNLISNNPDKRIALEGHGIEVSDMIRVVSDDPDLREYYDWKRRNFRHSL
jgi:3,4-dihydroxy 2-butanone 4-phosphate synthase/GTP cyclohydrolase II